MIIAYNKNKERIHIDEASRKEKYYCPTCGEELAIKRGNIKAHHYSHKAYSNCDGWHYDMSDWHSLWQSQFPIENQEVVFELNGKKHRADVFINNTVIEFQHSKLSYEEFKDRNVFYTSLGYRVIWILDATHSYLNSEIEEYGDNNYSWRNSPVQIRGYDIRLIDVYLQEFKNIWTSHQDYKKISMYNDDLMDYAYLHHIDETASISPDTFLSTGKNNLYDYEFINKFIPVKFLHDGSFDLNLEMKKKEYYLNDISDEILTIEEQMFDRTRFIWCPSSGHFVNPNDSCHACIHLSEKNDRCKFRFEKLLSKEFDRIVNIDYSDEGKIKSVTILKDKKRYRVIYDSVPKCILTIKEAFEDMKNTQIIRVRNIKTGWKAQISKYNYDMMLKYNKCSGKVQGPDSWSANFSKTEKEIFNFNKREWEIIWRK